MYVCMYVSMPAYLRCISRDLCFVSWEARMDGREGSGDLVRTGGPSVFWWVGGWCCSQNLRYESIHSFIHSFNQSICSFPTREPRINPPRTRWQWSKYPYPTKQGKKTTGQPTASRMARHDSKTKGRRGEIPSRPDEMLKLSLSRRGLSCVLFVRSISRIKDFSCRRFNSARRQRKLALLIRSKLEAGRVRKWKWKNCSGLGADRIE